MISIFTVIYLPFTNSGVVQFECPPRLFWYSGWRKIIAVPLGKTSLRNLLWVLLSFLQSLSLSCYLCVVTQVPSAFEVALFVCTFKKLVIVGTILVFGVRSRLLEDQGHVVFFEHNDSEKVIRSTFHLHIESVIVIFKQLSSIDALWFSFHTY